MTYAEALQQPGKKEDAYLTTPYSDALAEEEQLTTPYSDALAEASKLSTPYTDALARTATYIDENGDRQTGVVADTGGNSSELSYWDSMKQYYEQIYSDQVKANNTAAASAAEQALTGIRQQIDALDRQYAGTNRELYRNYMDTKRTLPQQLAAQGYSGGLTESSRLGLDTSYTEALAENERARQTNVTGLNAQGAQAKYEADAAAASANASALNQKGQYLAALETQKYEQETTDKQNRAAQLAAVGDFSGYLGLGYTQGEADYMTQLWLTQNPGLRNIWISAHPEDAARLGVTETTTASPTYSGPPDDTIERLEKLYSKTISASQNPVTTKDEILASINGEYQEGNITKAEADRLKGIYAPRGMTY